MVGTWQKKMNNMVQTKGGQIFKENHIQADEELSKKHIFSQFERKSRFLSSGEGVKPVKHLRS